MSSKTKIVVLHMKEIIYTFIFIALGILLILLLTFMFLPRPSSQNLSENLYTPGVYTSTMTINNTALEVEVTVDESYIHSIRFSNLDESVTTMYPLIQPAMEDIADQIYEKQSTSEIIYSDSNPYTSQTILNAISEALKKAEAP